MADAHDSLAELAAKAPKKPQALFYVLLDLADLEFMPEGDDFPMCIYMGQPVEPVSGPDYQAVSDYINNQKWERDE